LNTNILVSVICLCHNQSNYVREAISSVLSQSYESIELIIVDDASSDQSKEIIKQIVLENPGIQFIDIQENAGNCKAFNLGFRQSKGQYIIDFAADDMMLPNRIETQVHDFKNLHSSFGVAYSDAIYIDEKGALIHRHSDKYKFHPSEWIYEYLLEKYFVCPPTMMIKREVLEALSGYDEQLLYEDFDFWIRSARDYQYHYNEEPLTKKRVLKSGHGNKFNEKRNPIQYSTFKVCKKAFLLNRNRSENIALAKRILTEIKLCLKTSHFDLIKLYSQLIYQFKDRLFLVDVQIGLCLLISGVIKRVSRD
jgi:glycosyltransferase involved in cell wall biosynthesis